MNNLTQREKILIYAVLSILPIVILFFGFNWFMNQLQAKSDELRTAQSQLADIETRSRVATNKAILRNEFRQRSLSAEETVAQGEYSDWLRDLVENEIKFSGPPKVSFLNKPPSIKSDLGDKRPIYDQFNFKLECTGTYQQVVDLLYQFYEKNYIHRITRLDLNLTAGKRTEGKIAFDRKRFTVKAQIQVLSLVDADEDGTRAPIGVDNYKLFYTTKDNEVIHTLDDYYAVVLRRNLFGFPNNAPDFGSRKKEFDFEEGDRISLRLSADDEDDDDLEYSLVSTDGKVSSDKIEQSRSGSFRLDIKELGTYEFRAEVVDKNYYPKSDTMLVSVVIEEKEVEPIKKEKPKPKFDHLKYTMLQGIPGNFNGKSICWIDARTLGETFKVAEGEEFEVADHQLKIVKINRRDAIIDIDGDQFRFGLGDSLRNPIEEILAAEKESKDDQSDSLAEKGKSEDRKPVDQESTESQTKEGKTIEVKTENPGGKQDPNGSAKSGSSEPSKDSTDDSPEEPAADKKTGSDTENQEGGDAEQESKPESDEEADATKKTTEKKSSDDQADS